MLKTKIISAHHYEDAFQKEVNDWLKTNQSFEIVDIKYSTAHKDKVGFHYSAMIIYKERKQVEF